MKNTDKENRFFQKLISERIFDNIELLQKHNSYIQELHELQSIEEGNVEMLKKSWEEEIGGEYGHIADDVERQARNLCIITITNASRAAIRGGVIPEIAYTVSDIYLYQVEKISVDKLMELVKAAEIQFTLMVKKIRDDTSTQVNINDSVVAKCRDYTLKHLHEKDNLVKMAAEFGYNTSYLSTKFKKKTNIPLKKYIINEKLKAAEELLIYSKYRYSDIAAILGFCSQSHLGKAFQEKNGMTLREYQLHWQKLDDYYTIS